MERVQTIFPPSSRLKTETEEKGSTTLALAWESARSMASNGRNNRRHTPCVSLDSPAPSVVRRETLPAPSEALSDFQAMRWTRFIASCPPRAPALPRAACAKCT